MAIPLRKFAKRCEEVAIANDKITALSSSTVSLYEISRQWRKLADATSFLGNPPWSEKEEAAAEVIIAALTYLQRIGCKDIEKCLKDTLERQSRKL